MVSLISTWSHRLGLALAAPALLAALWLGAVATWETRPLPRCVGNGLDLLNPTQKCRRYPVPSGPPSLYSDAGSAHFLLVEQGTVSGAPDFRSAGGAAALSLMLYLVSRGLGWLLSRLARGGTQAAGRTANRSALAGLADPGGVARRSITSEQP